MRDSGGATGRVIAILKDAIYVETLEGYVVCFLDRGAFDGPLTIRVGDFGLLRAKLEGQLGVEVHATADALVIESVAHLGWRHTRRWQPALPDRLGSAEARQQATKRLALVLAAAQPLNMEKVLSRGQDVFVEVAYALKACNLNKVGDALVSLLGMGGGLTPEGDDILVGALALLVWRGEPEAPAITRMAQAVRETARHRTNKISARLLHHASDGVLYAPAMELGAALLAGEQQQVDELAPLLLSIGNTTGWAMAWGLLQGMLTMEKIR